MMVRISIVNAVTCCVLLAIIHHSIEAVELTFEEVKRICANRIVSIESIEQFQQLADALRQIHSGSDESDNETKGKSLAKLPCEEQKHQILDLDELIRRTGHERDVCHPAHINALSAYHRNYVQRTPFQHAFRAFYRSNYTWTRPFFKRYARAVSLTCHRNLFLNLAEADVRMTHDQQVDLAREKNQRKRNLELILMHDVETGETTKTNNQNGKMSFADPGAIFDGALPFKVYKNLIKQADRVQRPEELELEDDAERLINTSIALTLPLDRESDFRYQIDVCQRHARYYESAIKSIALLARLGYAWDLDKLYYHVPESKDSENSLQLVDFMSYKWLLSLKKWLGITQRCSVLLSLHVSYSDRVEYGRIWFANPHEIETKNNKISIEKAHKFERNNFENLKRNFNAFSNGQVETKPTSEVQYHAKQIWSQNNGKLFLYNLVFDLAKAFNVTVDAEPVIDQLNYRETRDTGSSAKAREASEVSKDNQRRSVPVDVVRGALIDALLAHNILSVNGNVVRLDIANK